jgi:hypothetical protein
MLTFLQSVEGRAFPAAKLQAVVIEHHKKRAGTTKMAGGFNSLHSMIESAIKSTITNVCGSCPLDLLPSCSCP